jgi:hypothetical protein
MTSRIFNVVNDRLVEMVESPFANEDIFQDLLRQYPDLLTGDLEQGDSPRKWLLIRREMGIAAEEGAADRWSLDHLFVDQDGMPTLVEVKRSSDTRIRREVVGQLLDYAANAVVHWSIDRVQAEFIENCSREGVDPETRLAAFLGNANSDDFWQKVKTNLQAGKIRLLFVADVIPAELKRIIEFLNTQMDPAEVLGVEIRHYEGQGLKTLVPRIIGQTAESIIKKNPGSRRPNLTKDELQAIANERGVGELYSVLVKKLSGCFKNSLTTQSNITFISKLPEYKTGAAVFTLSPGDSSTSSGVRFGAYTDSLAFLCQVDSETILKALPSCELVPTWHRGYYAGFAADETSFDEIIRLLLLQSGNDG